MNYVVKLYFYQINLQTKIINSIKNDNIKIYQENIYSFNVQDIQKKLWQNPYIIYSLISVQQ